MIKSELYAIQDLTLVIGGAHQRLRPKAIQAPPRTSKRMKLHHDIDVH